MPSTTSPVTFDDVPGRRWVVILASSEPQVGRSWGEPYRTHLARVLCATAAIPAERTIVVVLESDSPWWAPILSRLPPNNVLEQPFDRGSATALLLALLRVSRLDPAAELLIATLGADPDELARWASAPADGEVEERPVVFDHEEGRVTLCAASADVLLRLFRGAQPELLSAMLDFVGREGDRVDLRLGGLYPFLPAIDFALDVVHPPTRWLSESRP